MPLFVPEAKQAGDTRIDDNDQFFLYVGRLEKVKGLRTLIPLFKGRTRAQLLVAGTGSDELQLRELASGSNIRFLGHLAEVELQRFYRRAVAVIVPSLCFEISPLVMLEAFRHGIPVIARNLGGMAELIADSGGGVTYDSDEELRAAMDRMLDEKEERATLGLNGHHAYQRQWTTQAYLERYFGLIDDLRSKRELQACGV